MINYSSIFAVLWESEKQKKLGRGIVIIYSLLCHSKKHNLISFCVPQRNSHIQIWNKDVCTLNNDRSFIFGNYFLKSDQTTNEDDAFDIDINFVTLFSHSTDLLELTALNLHILSGYLIQ